MFKVIIFSSCLVTISLASLDGWNSDAKYKFEYGMQDPHTGDHKSQWEISNGDGLKGGYTLDEADGTKRVVQYKADKWNGFQAFVKRIGHAVHPQSYGAPFVVRHQDDQQSNGYDLGHVSNGNGKQYNQQQNGWNDQQNSFSSKNGGKNGAEMFATSFVNQKIYH